MRIILIIKKTFNKLKECTENDLFCFENYKWEKFLLLFGFEVNQLLRVCVLIFYNTAFLTLKGQRGRPQVIRYYFEWNVSRYNIF